MKNLIRKTVEKFTGAEVHANHTAIKGRKSSGIEDSASYKNWKNAQGSNPVN